MGYWKSGIIDANCDETCAEDGENTCDTDEWPSLSGAQRVSRIRCVAFECQSEQSSRSEMTMGLVNFISSLLVYQLSTSERSRTLDTSSCLMIQRRSIVILTNAWPKSSTPRDYR